MEFKLKTGKYILLIEDNNTDKFLVTQTLKKEMWDYKEVMSENEAIEYLFCHRNVNDLPDLIVLNLTIPELNGIKLLEKIRKTRQTEFIPVVFMSAKYKSTFMADAYHFGANSLILKPNDISMLEMTINQLAFYWLVINQTASIKVTDSDKMATNGHL